MPGKTLRKLFDAMARLFTEYMVICFQILGTGVQRATDGGRGWSSTAAAGVCLASVQCLNKNESVVAFFIISLCSHAARK